MADGSWQAADGRGQAAGRALPRALLIDCLGTLLRLQPPAAPLRRSLARRGLEVAADEAERAIGAEIRYYLAHHLEGRDERSLASLREDCARVVADSLGISGHRLAEVRDALLEALRFEPYADAAPALRALRSAGVGLFVVSNWDCSLPATLEAAGLAALLDGVVTSAAVGAAKPDPRPLLAGLELARCPPEAAICIGDSLEVDVTAARAAQIEPWLLARGDDRGGEAPRRSTSGASPGPARTVRSLADVRSLLLPGSP